MHVQVVTFEEKTILTGEGFLERREERSSDHLPAETPLLISETRWHQGLSIPFTGSVTDEMAA